MYSELIDYFAYESGDTSIHRMRLLVVLLLARLVGWLSRLRGHGGSSLPGMLALKWQPMLLRDLKPGLRQGSVLITGTNGKTTTAAMVRRILSDNRWHLVSNHNGANLLAGLATSFMRDRRHLIPRADLALLEVDEATMPRAADELRPQAIVVTNVFRDQLDRYGELSTTLRYIQRGIDRLAEDGSLILNADDPQVAYLGEGRAHVVYFGLDPSSSAQASSLDNHYDASDSDRCPRCATRLEYPQRVYAHLGHYRCPHCGYQRPAAAITVTPGQGGEATLSGEFGNLSIILPIPGIYNLYNLAAAAALSWVLGVHPESMALALADMPPAFGRMEAIVVAPDTKIWIALVKNPVGFNQVMDTIIDSGDKPNIFIVINDRYADGRDVSWLWDVDFERSGLRVAIDQWWVSGIRAWDMALRLKYAGIPQTQVVVLPSVSDALAAAIKGSQEKTLYILPTYTALMEVRDLLTRQGLVKHFRDG